MYILLLVIPRKLMTMHNTALKLIIYVAVALKKCLSEKNTSRLVFWPLCHNKNECQFFSGIFCCNIGVNDTWADSGNVFGSARFSQRSSL